MIWGGIALMGVAFLTIFGVIQLPKVLITLEFFLGLGLIMWGMARNEAKGSSK